MCVCVFVLFYTVGGAENTNSWRNSSGEKKSDLKVDYTEHCRQEICEFAYVGRCVGWVWVMCVCEEGGGGVCS